jgi:hypothetical protein
MLFEDPVETFSATLGLLFSPLVNLSMMLLLGMGRSIFAEEEPVTSLGVIVGGEGGSFSLFS